MPAIAREMIITTPSGRCPVKLGDYDAESVMLWGDQIRDIGRQYSPSRLYSLPALIYWARTMNLTAKQFETVKQHLMEIYSDEVGLLKVGNPLKEPARKNERPGVDVYADGKDAQGAVPVRRTTERGESPADEPGDDKPRTSKRRAKIFGHSTTAILRWMGAAGFTEEQARAALKHYGDAADISDASVKMQMYDGSTGKFKFGPLIELTGSQMSELNQHAGRVAVKAERKSPRK